MPPNSKYSSLQRLLRARLERPIDPRVRRIKIESRILGVTKHFYVALPPGYGSVATAYSSYPVIYLFRGHEREWVHREQDKSRRSQTVIDVYQQLLHERKVGQVILVFPGISSDDNRVPGLLVNFRAPELADQTPGIGTGRFEDYFLGELVPYVDSHFRTVASKEGRAVDGFSLGGFQAIKIAAQRPDLFASAGSFDGTFLYAAGRGEGVRVRDRVLHNPMLSPAFGTPRDLDYVAANSPANLLWRGNRAELAKVQWLVRSGPEQGEPWHSNYYRAQHVIEILKARALQNGIEPVLAGAWHNWHWADRHMRDTLPLHWQALNCGGTH